MDGYPCVVKIIQDGAENADIRKDMSTIKDHP